MNIHNHKTLSIYLFIAIIASSTALYTSDRRSYRKPVPHPRPVRYHKQVFGHPKPRNNTLDPIAIILATRVQENRQNTQEANQTNQPNRAIIRQKPQSQKRPDMVHDSRDAELFNQRDQAKSTQKNVPLTLTDLDTIIEDSSKSFRQLKEQEDVAQQADTTAVAAQNNEPESKSMCTIQ